MVISNLSGSRIISVIFKYVIAGTLYFYILSHVGISELKEIKPDFRYYYIIPIFAVLFLTMVFSSYRWQLFLALQNIKVSLINLIQINWIGFFFNMVFPSTISGDALMYYYTRKEGNRINVLLSIIMGRFMNVSASVIMGSLVLTSVYCEIPTGASNVILILFLCWLFVVLLIGSFKVKTISNLLRKIRLSWFSRKIVELKDGVKLIIMDKKKFTSVVILSLIIKLNVVLLVFFIILFLGLEVPFIYLIIFVPIIDVITLIPISVGGLGIRENAYVFFLSSVGILPQEGLAISLMLSLSMICWGLIGGGIYLFKR